MEAVLSHDKIMIKRFHLDRLLQDDYDGKTYWSTSFGGVKIDISVSLDNLYVYPVDPNWIYVSVYMWRNHLIPYDDLNDRALPIYPLTENMRQCTLDCVIGKFPHLSSQMQAIIQNFGLKDNPRDVFFLQNVALTVF